jgi:V/A-type H+/Na+-transporting ATPase subunit D
MAQINPTRINLINTRKSKVLARKGYDLLKRKREVLVIEFLKLLKESTNDRDYVQKKLQDAYNILAYASTYVGDFELDSIANYVKEPSKVEIEQKNIMGVKIPEISRIVESSSIADKGYSLMSTSIAVDDVNESFNEVINSVVDLAKREQGLKRLVLEIEKVKRRVNALDYRLIPELEKRQKYISMRLEEIDRDNFSALKHVKKKLGKQE